MGLFNNSLMGNGLFGNQTQSMGLNYNQPNPAMNIVGNQNQMGFNPLNLTAGAGQNPNGGGLLNWWGNNGQSVTQGIGALTGLANLYAGFKALGMQEDQMNFSMDATRTQINNNVQDYENKLRDQHTQRSAWRERVGGEQFASWDDWSKDRKLERMS
jgi:hypothetical protein